MKRKVTVYSDDQHEVLDKNTGEMHHSDSDNIVYKKIKDFWLYLWNIGYGLAIVKFKHFVFIWLGIHIFVLFVKRNYAVRFSL